MNQGNHQETNESFGQSCLRGKSLIVPGCNTLAITRLINAFKQKKNTDWFSSKISSFGFQSER